MGLKKSIERPTQTGDVTEYWRIGGIMTPPGKKIILIEGYLNYAMRLAGKKPTERFPLEAIGVGSIDEAYAYIKAHCTKLASAVNEQPGMEP